MKIICVGMNYALHNKELDGALYKPEAPVIFLKPDSSLLKDNRPFFLPDDLGRIEYEAELVVRICKLGKSIPVRFAHRYYDAVTCGVDFTARELQQRLRAEGKPWELCKGFDGAAAIGEWVPIAGTDDVQRVHFSLDINGRTVQKGYAGDMLYTVDEIISYVSQWLTLRTGDLVFTGTPVGVGAVNIDDHLVGKIEENKVLEFNVK